MTSEHRSTERRIADRRARRAMSADESWFEAFGSSDGLLEGDSALAIDRLDTDHGTLGAGSEAARGGSSRGARRSNPGEETEPGSFARLYRTFIGARAVLGLALVSTLALVAMLGVRPSGAVVLVSGIYTVLAIGMWSLPRIWDAAMPRSMTRLSSPRWFATIGADLLCFTTLHLLSPGGSLNYVALLVMPVLMAAVLTPRKLALATVAGVALILLLAAWLEAMSGSASTELMTQVGLAGSGFFVLAVLAGELAARLEREERSSRGSRELARQQAQLNRLVIEEMQDGVLVVDRRGLVRAANPAARRLLWAQGMCQAAPFQLRGVPAWSALVKTVERAFVDAAWPEAGRDVTLEFSPGGSRTLRVRIRFTRKPALGEGEELCVLFLEDLRTMQARSRQEKLAAMGRVSAGVAHEIRNPLAAIAQANALLMEESRDPGQRKLMQMVTSNVERLKRIVDDVMAVAPGQAMDMPAVDATPLVAAIASEWAQAAIAPADQNVLKMHLPDEALGVIFDAEHLRRVLINLLDNALRHASRSVGAIEVRLDSRDATRVFLSVSSDGSLIPADVERYLFEPFFSTRSRGTGLGLYICRELCERYGASIDYRLRHAADADRNEFFVAMHRTPITVAQERMPATP
jgi:two-component system sensor histidine kinase PilS (NtrC family)